MSIENDLATEVFKKILGQVGFNGSSAIPGPDDIEPTPEVVLLNGIPSHFFNAKIKRAREYALIMHDGQMYGDRPYIEHLADTYRVFVEFTFEHYLRDKTVYLTDLLDKYESTLCALWLHDTIEDTAATKDELQDFFNLEVADLVWAVTGEGENRKERLSSIADKIETLNPAIIIKLCDRIANTRYSKQHSKDTTFKMYQSEYPDFKAKLEHHYPNVPVIRRLWTELDILCKEGT